MTGGGWAIAGVKANGGGDTYGSQCWFARVSGVGDGLASIVPICVSWGSPILRSAMTA